MKNLETMGVQEMDANDSRSSNGGCALAIAIGIAAWGIANLIHDCVINHEQLDITSW